MASERLTLGDHLDRADRTYGPSLLWDAWASADPDALDVIGRVWEMSEFPQRAYRPATIWVDMFRAAGFRVDDQPSQRPTEVQVLYRGAPIRGVARRGFSWTPDVELAKWFSDRNDLFGFPSAVWRSSVDPSSVLAGLTGRKGEGTTIVDTKGLAIVRAGDLR